MSADAHSTADSKYVESHLETVLTKLLAELYLVKPSDPGSLCFITRTVKLLSQRDLFV